MLALQGQFTFTADRPQLHCAAFFIGEPEEFVTVRYDLVSIDCQGGDFLKVGCPRRAAPSSGQGATSRGGTEQPGGAVETQLPRWDPRERGAL